MENRPFLLRYRSSNLYVLITASFSVLIGAIIYSIIIPILPFIIDEMKKGTSPQESDLTFKNEDAVDISSDTLSDSGIILGMYAASSIITGPIFGYLGDKSRLRRTPMLLGIFSLFLTTILFLFATQYWMLILARILQGVSDACVYTLSLSLVSDTFPQDVLGSQLGKVMTFQSIGIAAGSPIGVLFDKFGYRGPSIFCMILVGMDFFLRLFLIERRNNPIVFPTRNHPSLPIYLKNGWGYSASQIGLVTLALGIPPFISVPLSGYLYDRFGQRYLCSIAMFLSGAVLLPMGIPTSSTGGGIATLVVIIACASFILNMALTPVATEVSCTINSLFNATTNNITPEDIQQHRQEKNTDDEGYFGRSFGVTHSVFCLGKILIMKGI
ncbi:major facilitator superfamily domain-containing protein [Phascolomyces articulosus]|uniref:Major facilitator superfamily domain-containing protein n=1 Tax=Phascolomyces articulosus TaxID=60185 RepID=A0AAD5K4G8_9FUNG|nr:major facilitator superfamily domain-containing protein [Phascolomyces articulosus]